jgi:hypothetical protein
VSTPDERPNREAELEAQVKDLQDILGSVWLYINWRYVTKQLTTPQKEMFADAVEAWHQDLNSDDPEYAQAWKIDRWWRDA